MITCRLFVVFAVALVTLGRLSESAAPTVTSSSHHYQNHRSSALEISRMMAAHDQLGLYMTLSETSRGGDCANAADDNDAKEGGSQRTNPTIRACENAVINARKATFKFGNSLRRDAIRHLRLDDDA